MQNKQRFIQPKNVKEAMNIIQNLFNSYRHYPLSSELITYHTQLTKRLQTDIYVEAIKENNPTQLKMLENMISAMNTWLQIRASNKPFNGKMKNFKLTSGNTPKFKTRNHKIKGNHNYHASRH